MTIDEAKQLKPGDLIRLVDVRKDGPTPQGYLLKYLVREGRGHEDLVFKRAELRGTPSLGPLLIFEGAFMYGAWPHECELAVGPW